MMMTHTCIYTLINQKKGLGPSEILDRVNYVIKENIRRLDVSRYVTLTILKLEKNIIVHSGKHQDILIYRAAEKKIETVTSNGTWIGITDQILTYLQDDEIQIYKGDVVLLYTDGVTEAESKDKKMYGIDRLKNTFFSNAHMSVQAIVDNIVADVIKYQSHQTDDITVLACRKL
jgi:sigma-B regulation protein RsbU (phosphoserine phosphatase)